MPAIPRRQFLEFLSASALMPIISSLGIQTPATLPTYAERAVAAYKAQQAFFYRGHLFAGDTTRLYLPNTPQGDSRPYSFVWPYSLAMSATLDLYGLPDSVDYLDDIRERWRGSEAYWDGRCFRAYTIPPLGHGGNRYWDDNAWLGLNLVRTYRITRDIAALRRAQQVFDYMVDGWDDDPSHPTPGGIFWMEAPWNRERGTISTAGGAELGLRLYQHTAEATYLAWAKRMYDWVNRTLLDSDGLYWDHIDLDGLIDKGKASYTQGTMVGAGGLLYQVTGDTLYLENAKRTACESLRYYGNHGYTGMEPAFNAIFLRNLLYLSTVDSTHLPATLEAMQHYADGLWQDREDKTDLFKFGPNDGKTTLEVQSAVTCIFACLACDPAKHDLLL